MPKPRPDSPANGPRELSAILRERLALVRLVIFDVDGVLTDGSLGGSNSSSRRWNVKDGFGFHLARKAGLEIALCSGYDAPDIRERAERLRLSRLKLGRNDKGKAVRELLQELGLAPGEALFVGDDLFDLPGMRAAGLGAAPADARPEVRERADWVLASAGGAGAAREVLEEMLKSRGEWEARVQSFLEEEDD